MLLDMILRVLDNMIIDPLSDGTLLAEGSPWVLFLFVSVVRF